MKTIAFLLLALGLTPRESRAQETEPKTIVVVFEIEDRSKKLSQATKEQLTDYLVSLLTKGGFEVVPRAQVKERIREAQKGSYKACYDQSCQIELGRELAAQKSLSSQVLKLGNQCKITVNLYDLKKAASEKAGMHSGGCKENDIVASLENAVESLLPGSTGQTSKNQPMESEPNLEINERIAAYKRGEHEHAYDIGMAFLNGQMGAKQNFTMAKQWFTKAVSHGDIEACVELGDRYMWGQGTRLNEKEAFKWYRKAAEVGNPLGQEKLAGLYASSQTMKKDMVKAAHWYQKACEQEKRSEPCHQLADMYTNGEGVKASRAEALKRYLKASELGDDSAGPAISLIYEHGAEGVPRDLVKAQDWLKASAKNGYTPAMAYLGTAYAGESYQPLFEVNLVEAYKWLAVYVEKDTRPQREAELLKKIAAKLSPADLERAKKEAAEMIEKYVTPQDREDKAYLQTLPGR